MSYFSLRSLVCRILTSARKAVVAMAAVAICFGWIQPQAMAASNPATANDQVAVESFQGKSLDQLKADRRARQSQRSEAADTESDADSLGEVVEEKLNLDEIVEENVLLNDDAQPAAAARRK